MNGSATLTLADVEQARERLRPYLPPTPLRRTFCVPGLDLYLKLECWQPTGSFKVRGALNALLALPSERQARGVVAASAGNHALGVAHAVQALGGRVAATLFLPETAPAAKREKLRRFPVELRTHGRTYEEAHAEAVRHAASTGAFYVHAFDDPLTAAGQGTVGLEVLDQLPEVGSLLVPVGGGGLIAALAVAVKAHRPAARVVAVQPEASPALRESLRLGRALLDYRAGATLCDGLAGGIGELVFRHRALLDAVVEVSEPETEAAIVRLLAEEQLVVEASGAVGLAALLGGRLPALPQPIVLVLTGANLDAAVLARLLQRGL